MPRSICVIAMACLLAGGCTGTIREAPSIYVVQPQDTLYSIAWRHNLDYRDIARWNHIGGDFRISVGQRLNLGASGERRTPPIVVAPTGAVSAGGARVGGAAVKPSASTAAPIKRGSPIEGPVAGPDSRTPALVTPQASPAVLSKEGGKWAWPTEHTAAPRPVPGAGILVFGSAGQDIRAASGGRVVYAGSGIRGYGNLIIINHSDALLSAYAHNRDLLVHDGQEVVLGQIIAHMGEGPTHTPALYFEIRQNGRPVDVLPFLRLVK